MALQSDQEFAPTQIARAVFPTAFRGYDQDAVRRYLSRLASALEHQQEYAGLGELEARTPAHERVDELESEVEDLRQEIRDLELELVQRSVSGEGEAAETAADAVPFDEHRAIELLGKETARVLESARSAAADILKRAETQAASLKAQAKSELSEARRRAETLVTDAQTAADDLTNRLSAQADAEAERIRTEAAEHREAVLEETAKMLTEAEELAEAEQADAEQRAKQIVADAETLRQQVVSELVAERREAQSDMDRITAARDRLAMSLAVARSELDEVADALVDVSIEPPEPPTGVAADRPDADDGPSAEAEVAELIEELTSTQVTDGGEANDTDDGPAATTLNAGSMPDTEAEAKTAADQNRKTDNGKPGKPKAAEQTATGDKSAAGAGADKTVPANTSGSANGAKAGDRGPGNRKTSANRTLDAETGADKTNAAGEGSAKKNRRSKKKAGGNRKAIQNGAGATPPAADENRDPAKNKVDQKADRTGSDSAPADGRAGAGPSEAAGSKALVKPSSATKSPSKPATTTPTAAAEDNRQPPTDDGDADDDVVNIIGDDLAPAGDDDDPELNRLPGDGQELSLVQGFTTIDANDLDLRATDQPGGAASTSTTGGTGGILEEDRVPVDQTPEDVITTVASRTSVGPDRTQGDLLVSQPFTGRLPKEFSARDLALTRSGPNFRRQLRRALNDDQSDVLDRLRAGRGPIRTDELPSFAEQMDRYRAPLRRGLAEIAQGGAKAGGNPDLSNAALDNLVRQLARYIVDRVRTPTMQIVDEDQSQDRELILEPIRALYRDFRNVGLPDLSEDALYEAFAIGLYDSIPAQSAVRWTLDPRSDPDPVCDINSRRLDVIKGDTFPSGHARPLSLPGCRCLVTAAPG